MAQIDFGALTLIRGTTKLSYSVGELIQIFCNRESFMRAHQPISGDTREYARIRLSDDQALVITAKGPWRHFAEQGTLRLLMSDGREFECRVTKRGAEFFAGGQPLPAFSPTCKTIAVLKHYATIVDFDPREDETRTVEECVAQYLGISVTELLACLRGTVRDDSIFDFDYLIDEQDRCQVQCYRNGGHLPISSLSSGEKSRVILDVAVRIATYTAKVSAAVLLVHQWAVPSDDRGITWFLKWIAEKKPPFQTVMELVLARPETQPHGALCYEVQGTDMDVTAFSLVPSSQFCHPEPMRRI